MLALSSLKSYLTIGAGVVVLVLLVGIYVQRAHYDAKISRLEKQVVELEKQITIVQTELASSNASLQSCNQTLKKVQAATQNALNQYGSIISSKDAHISQLRKLLQTCSQSDNTQGGQDVQPSESIGSGDDVLLDMLNSLFVPSQKVRTHNPN